MMKTIQNILGVVIFLTFIFRGYGQAPNLGTAANFVVFSTNGSVSNTGTSILTGNIGTNNGSSTAFGNVDGVMHDQNGTSAQAASDLLIAYNQLNSRIPTLFPSPLLGNGQALLKGIHSISGAATISGNLTLNAQGDANAVFIIQIQGALSTASGSRVILANGTKACNVFWKVEGLVNMETGSTMKGTVIANNAAMHMKTGMTLEGRVLTTTGAITVAGTNAKLPIGCGSAILTGPQAPNLASTACYALFSKNGPVTNSGVTNVKGDVGTNVGLTSGFNNLLVNGMIHLIPDASTAMCASDLQNVYGQLNTLAKDIELLFPQMFGRNLVLTPHTYLLNAATVLTDTLFLNAQGNADGVFVMKINGAFSTSTFSKVVLQNGAQAKNVFWKIDGAVSINNFSEMKGTFVCNNAAIDLKLGVRLEGRAFCTTGALTTNGITANMPMGCTVTAVENILENEVDVTLYPNPSKGTTILGIRNIGEKGNVQFTVFDLLGNEMMRKSITEEETIIGSEKLPSGIYLYRISTDVEFIKSGRLIVD